VSDTTLTGRQWGIAPRLGVAWSPSRFRDKIVLRAGTGMYYDRGELFSYLSPGYAAGETTAGPFGVNQAPPFVTTQICPVSSTLYQGFIPTCSSSLADPWGPTEQPLPSGNPQTIISYLPNAAGIESRDKLFSFATYDPATKLP